MQYKGDTDFIKSFVLSEEQPYWLFATLLTIVQPAVQSQLDFQKKLIIKTPWDCWGDNEDRSSDITKNWSS